MTLFTDLDAFYQEHESTAAISTPPSRAIASGWRVHAAR